MQSSIKVKAHHQIHVASAYHVTFTTTIRLIVDGWTDSGCVMSPVDCDTVPWDLYPRCIGPLCRWRGLFGTSQSTQPSCTSSWSTCEELNVFLDSKKDKTFIWYWYLPRYGFSPFVLPSVRPSACYFLTCSHRIIDVVLKCLVPFFLLALLSCMLES